jgi:glycosyltransferase involved in cell wall biosynthesis
MPGLSVIIITFNEQNNIGRCIDSVIDVADEVIVLDSDSTDRTIEIASGKGAKTYQQKFAGYGQQKNDALKLATHDLVLSLDADEALDSILKKEIASEKKSPTHDGYSMNRCTNYCGRFIRHGSWYPDTKIRLFNRKMGKWSNDRIHEKVEMIPASKIRHLRGDILHYSFNSIADHVDQNNKFSSISAEFMFDKGRRTNVLKLLLNPSWAFILSYIIRLGFADGIYGLIIAVNISHLTFLKHSKLLTLQLSRNKST